MDILSYKNRKNIIFVFTLDNVLAADISQRLADDPRTKPYQVIMPGRINVKNRVEEIEQMATETINAKLIILDIRGLTHPILKQAYNKIVGYNRKDFNQSCFTIAIGDGPVNLFQQGRSYDIFVPFLTHHRVDYNYAAYFFDPFIHYEPAEKPNATVDYEVVLPQQLPKRLLQFFKQSENVKVDHIRKFFRAVGKPTEVKQQRLKILLELYKKRISEQLGNHDVLKELLTKNGVQLATENLRLYPLFFEEFVYDIMKTAK
jgi:hypothetical protein